MLFTATQFNGHARERSGTGRAHGAQRATKLMISFVSYQGISFMSV